jgi:hypothetical protein
MLRKIHETNIFHIKFLGRNSIKCQNGQVLPPAQVFYFNGQALHRKHPDSIQTDMFMHTNVLCGYRSRDLLRSRPEYSPAAQEVAG